MHDIASLKTELKTQGRAAGIAVDVDDTLADIIPHLMEQMARRFGNPEQLTVKEIFQKYRYTWNVPFWQNEAAQTWVLNAVHTAEIYDELPLIGNSNDMLHKIDKVTPIKLYLTARPVLAQLATERWLRKHNFPEAPVVTRPPSVDPMKANPWKAKILADLYPDVVGIIDDNPAVAEFLPKDYAGTIFVYNHDRLEHSDIEMIACKDWQQLLNKITEKFSR